MKKTAAESAELKQALKHDQVTDQLRAEADAFPSESQEALEEVQHHFDSCTPGSWVHEELAGIRESGSAE